MANGSYDYNKAIEQLGAGSDVYNAVKDYQDKIVALVQSVQKCEEGFHGLKDGSFYKSYQALYNTIGHYTDTYTGCWTCGRIASLRQYLDRLYFNAEYDKAADEQGKQERQTKSNLVF